jgi:hypothetical protein
VRVPSLEDIEVHPMPCANDRLRNSSPDLMA